MKCTIERVEEMITWYAEKIKHCPVDSLERMLECLAYWVRLLGDALEECKRQARARERPSPRGPPAWGAGSHERPPHGEG